MEQTFSHSVLSDSTSLNFTISIFDLGGRMISNTQLNMGNSGYTLPRLDRGIYILRALDSRNEVFATKIWQN